MEDLLKEKVQKEVKKLELPEESHRRILWNCMENIQTEQEKEEMKLMKQKNIKLATWFKKPLVAVAALAACCCLTGITAMATTGKGFFKDKTNWNGAITGQTYENATDEVLVYAAVEEDVLTVTVEMVKYEVAPYSEIELLELKYYRVVDATGTIVFENAVPEDVVIENNQVKFQIPAEGLLEGTYKLELDVLSGSKKADQDLLIYGNWECEFKK